MMTQKYILKLYAENKVEEQVNRVIDDMWNMDKEISEFISQESKIYDFDFEYKKENQKQLVEKYEPHFEKDEKFKFINNSFLPQITIVFYLRLVLSPHSIKLT